MARRFVDRDPLSGTCHYVDYDEDTDCLQYISEIDVDQILRHNHFDRSEAPRHVPLGQDMVFAARLPLNIFNDLCRRGIFQDRKAYLKWLEAHPEFKTWDGRLI